MLDLTERIQRYAEDLIEMYPDVTAHEVMRPHPTRSRLRPVLVAAAAAVIVLVVIGGLGLLLNRTDRTFIEPVTTTVLATTVTTASPTTTTTQLETTTTVAAPLVPTISWTKVDSPVLTEGYVQSMSIANDIVYLTGTADGFDHGVIWRSEDGQTWERFDLPRTPDLPTISDLGNPNVFGVAYHDGTTVAAGLDCTDSESACLAAVWISADNGHTWARTPHQEAFGSTGLHRMLAITATDSGFLAVGDDVWTSPDGLQWTMVEELPGNRHTMWDIVAAPDLIVGVGQRWDNGSEAAIWTSTDGIEWTRISDEDGDFSGGEGNPSFLTDVALTSYGYVAVGAAGTFSGGGDAAVWMSETGRTWRRIDSPSFKTGHSDTMSAIKEIDGILVAVGGEANLQGSNGNGVVWISADGGGTWTRLDDPDHIFGNYYAGNTGLGGVEVIDGKLIIEGDTGAPALWIGTLED